MASIYNDVPRVVLLYTLSHEDSYASKIYFTTRYQYCAIIDAIDVLEKSELMTRHRLGRIVRLKLTDRGKAIAELLKKIEAILPPADRKPYKSISTE